MIGLRLNFSSTNSHAMMPLPANQAKLVIESRSNSCLWNQMPTLLSLDASACHPIVYSVRCRRCDRCVFQVRALSGQQLSSGAHCELNDTVRRGRVAEF